MFLKLSRFFLYLSLFSVVIVMASTFFPFIGGKYYFFRASVSLAAICFFLSWALEDKEEIVARLRNFFRQPLFIAVTIFVLTYLLAATFAYDSHAAFWSNFERGEGAFQMLHYYAFFVLSLALFEGKDWQRLMKVYLWAAALLIGYGVLAFANPARFIGPGICGRFQGSLGNPSYVAPYLMFSIFYAAWLWFSEKTNAKRNFFYGGLIVFFFFFFILTQTRGSFFGLGAAVFFLLGYLSLFLPRKTGLRKTAFAGWIIYSAIAIAAVVVPHRNIPVIPFCESSSRLLEIKGTSLNTRNWTWGSAWAGFKERPLLGWGPENFSTVFDKYFNPKHFSPTQNSETWFDRAHSVIFDYLAETGVLGFLSYAAIFAVFYCQFFLNKFRGARAKAQNWTSLDWSRSATPREILRQGIIFSLFLGYLVQGLVLFDVLPIYINLFTLFAFSAYLYSLNKNTTENK